MASLGMSAADREAVEIFKRDVVEPSMSSLVILDFWAEWCGPCKALSPVLEKIAEDYAAKGVLLAKVNVDENKMIAAQFRVQTIPTVYAVFQGQIVADLTPARTEGQLKQMIDQILKQLPIENQADAIAQEIAPMIAMGEDLLAKGEEARALSVFTQLTEMAADHPQVLAGLARAHLALGDSAAAAAVLDSAPDSLAKDPLLSQVRAAIALAEQSASVGDVSVFEARLVADPDDHEARFELAAAMIAGGMHDAAAAALLEIIRRERGWNDNAARTRLLQLFEAVGLEDPWVSAQRRRLSAILFG